MDTSTILEKLGWDPKKTKDGSTFYASNLPQDLTVAEIKAILNTEVVLEGKACAISERVGTFKGNLSITAWPPRESSGGGSLKATLA